MKLQKGFTLVEGLLTVLILCFVGFAGWYVWDKQNSKAQVSQKASPASVIENENASTVDSQESKSESVPKKNWERYYSGKKAFSIEVADGLNGNRDTSNDFFLFNTFTSQDSPAKITDIDGFGSDGFFALMIYTDDTSNMYNSKDRLNEKNETFTTSNGLVGTKVSYDDPYSPPCEGLGCYLGDKHVVYDFPINGRSKTLRVWYARRVLNDESKKNYSISQDDPDYTSTIDEMVKTLEVN